MSYQAQTVLERFCHQRASMWLAVAGPVGEVGDKQSDTSPLTHVLLHQVLVGPSSYVMLCYAMLRSAGVFSALLSLGFQLHE